MYGRIARIGLAVVALSVGVAVASAMATGDAFSDDQGVHEPAINALAAEGILDGTECGEGLFCPQEPIRRWVAAVWLVRALGEAPAKASSGTGFGDVDYDEWWVPYVERLADLGISRGCGTGPLRFCPDAVVTRAQMATFLVRAFDIEESLSSGFVDTWNNVHEANIDALAAADITAGCSTIPPRFCPEKPVTRAQMATFIARARGLLESPAPAGRPVDGYTAVATGRWHTCGLRADGTIQCWGANSWGQADPPAGTYAAVAAGHRHSCAVRTDGAIRCWGNDYRGLTDVPPGTYTEVTAGNAHNCGLLKDGTARCWGNSDHGLTDAPPGAYRAVSAGSGYTCGLRSDRTIECWGGAYHYGHSDAPPGTHTAIAGGSYHACAVRTDGTVHCWNGRDYSGAQEPPAGTYADVVTGRYHSCGLYADRTIRCWGSEYGGVTDAPPGSYTSISAGDHHTCAVRIDGAIRCWGYNDGGQSDVPDDTDT